MLMVILVVTLVLDVVALVALLGSSAAVLQKLLWAMIILALPIVGVVFYFVLTEVTHGAKP